QRSSRDKRSRRTRALAAALVTVVLLLGLGLGWILLSEPTRKTERSDQPVPPDKKEPFWQVFPVGPADELFERLAFPSRQVGYVASRKAIYKTTDGGRSWERSADVAAQRVHLLHFCDERTGWLGTNQLHQTRDGGQTWQAVSLPEEMFAVTSLAV